MVVVVVVTTRVRKRPAHHPFHLLCLSSELLGRLQTLGSHKINNERTQHMGILGSSPV